MGEITEAHVKAKRHEAALKAWDKRGRKKDRGVAVRTATQPHGDWNQNNTEAQRMLMSSRVVESKKLGGGISETYVIKLESGQKANFKVDMGGTAVYEVAAWEVAQAIGMEDMVPPAVVREAPDANGVIKKGSAALWQEGEIPLRLSDYDARYDGQHDMQRAAMYDYIIGNPDRHEKNWVISPEGKIRLIDHNLAFQAGYAASQFLTRARTQELNGELKTGPQKFAAVYVQRKSQIASRLKAIGVPDDHIRTLMGRIDYAASVTTWDELQ